MNTKNYFLLAGIISIIYGLAFFFAPQQSASAYNLGDQTTDLSNMLLQFLGISILGSGILAIMARDASKSIGRRAILIYFAAVQILFLVFNLMGLAAGMNSSMDMVDIVVHLVIGGGAIYFLIKEKGEA